MSKQDKKPDPMKPASVKGKKQRSINAQPERPMSQGLPGHEQDPQRRLGNFTGTGEHARQGGRQNGGAGQSKKRSQDK